MRTIQNQTYLGTSILLFLCLTALVACQSSPPTAGEPGTLSKALDAPPPKSAEEVLIVDCLLPGQVRKLGRMTYLTPRRPAKSTALDCEIRGGEYVAFDRSNYATALNVWLGKANEGDATAQNYVGEIYQRGLGLEPQYGLAAQWFRKAADQGDPRAQINLGYLYERGLGVDKNSVEAINWYRKATGLDEALTLFGRQKQEELDALRQASELNRQEIESLKGQLESTQKELAEKQQQVVSRDQALEAERKKLIKARHALEAKKTQFASTDWTQLDGLARQLANRRVNLDGQHVLAAKLRNEIHDLTRRKQSLADSHQKELLRMNGEMARYESELKRQKNESASIKKEIELLEKQKHEASNADQNRVKGLTEHIEQRQSILDEQLLKAAQLGKDIQTLVAERKTLAAEQQERKRLMDQELARRETQLEQQRKQGESLKREIALLEEKKLRLSDENVADLTRLEYELSLREAELELKRKETDNLKVKVSQLDKEASSHRNELEKLKKKLADLPGPIIEIIDPSLLATRGIKRTEVKREVTKRRVIGKVTAAAGVNYVTINGKKQSLEDKGLFQSWVDIQPPGPTDVYIRARDRQGKDAHLRFSIASSRGLTNTNTVRSKSAKLNFGNYHALVIGNDDYRKLPKLKSPRNDAKKVSLILREKYGFQTTTMINANRFEIYTMLDKFRRELTEDDNFLIYYAGHGELDVANNRGYWLPIDAEPGSNINSIPNFTITDILNNMKVRQAIIVADTCYSGILTRSIVPMPKQSLTPEKRNKWLQKLAKSRSRTVLSSGGVKPILDVGFGNHSIFARAFLEILEANDDVLEASQLHRKLNAIVTTTSKKLGLEQIPLYAANPHAGHKSGDFLFVPIEYTN